MPVIACSFNTGWTCRHLLEEGPAVPVTLPHDAALAEPRTETAPGGTNTGWYEGYDYLYEKRFTPDAALQGQTLVLEFEGVYHNAEVWLNGEKLAFNPYGYTDFKVDLTGKLDFDAENVLQVIARNADQPNSRWYSGAGLYRPVWLHIAPKKRLKTDGIRIRTLSLSPAVVEVTAESTAPGQITIELPGAKQTLQTDDSGRVAAKFTLSGVRPWSCSSTERAWAAKPSGRTARPSSASRMKAAP